VQLLDKGNSLEWVLNLLAATCAFRQLRDV